MMIDGILLTILGVAASLAIIADVGMKYNTRITRLKMENAALRQQNENLREIIKNVKTGKLQNTTKYRSMETNKRFGKGRDRISFIDKPLPTRDN